MSRILPPPAEIVPLLTFLGLLLAFNMVAGYWFSLWATALYGAWLAVGIAVVVRSGVEPGLPRSFGGNLRRVLRAHIWPLYVG